MKCLYLLKDKIAGPLCPFDHEAMIFQRRLTRGISIETTETMLVLFTKPSSSRRVARCWSYFAAQAQTLSTTCGRAVFFRIDSRNVLLCSNKWALYMLSKYTSTSVNTKDVAMPR